MLTAHGITVQFGAKPLFENVSVKFGNGHCYGLIGANGSGKSTLMKVLGFELEPNAGSVALDDGCTLAMLRQDQFAYETQRVLDVVVMGHRELWSVLQEKDAIYANPEATDDDYIRAGELEARFSELDGYSAEARAAELLSGVGIEEALHAGPMSSVAPGYKLRVLLAQALFADPDILLLDEPTNNLDIHTIHWLEGMLNARDSTMVIISHDRHFLNAVCTHIADLDYQALSVYPGNYDEFMAASAQARAQVLSANTKAKEKIAQLQEFVRRFSANKSKARQATSRQRQIEKIRVEDIKPSSRQHPYIRFEQDKVLHRNVLLFKGLRKQFGENKPIINYFSASVEAGEKIAIIGQNGVGKTSLLRLLLGELAPEGEVCIRWAENAKLGYFSQDHSKDFESELSLLDWLSQWRQPSDDAQVVRSCLGRLLFSSDDAHKPVRVLSGGEKGRMLFGKLMLSRCNVLVMDEPTNHMDMESIESLNLALELFKGTVLFVSHDRQFVSSLASRVWEIKAGEVTDFLGDYDGYLQQQGM